MTHSKLTPLGDPAPNAPKWFAAVEMIRLAADQDWLHKATKEITKHWRHKDFRAVRFAPITKDFAPARNWRNQSAVTVLRAAPGDLSALYYVKTRMPLECSGFVFSHLQLTLRQLILDE